MASFEERVYQLGLEELAEQERQVAEMRGRAAALLAAGAVVPSLLARAVFHGHHPHGFDEVICTVLGVAGAGFLLVFALLLLWPRELGFSVNARATYQALWDQDILQQPLVDLALADAFHDRREARCGPSQPHRTFGQQTADDTAPSLQKRRNSRTFDASLSIEC